MTRGGRAALLTATVALGGCVSTSGVKVRAVADPISALPQGDDLAVARGQLALKNVGLALEAFRKAQRARPSDPAPLVGLADCYAVMGRFDLAQSNYEAALALAPRDPSLLLGLARVFELQGNLDRAAQTRFEAQQDAVAAAPVATASVTVALPPARPAAPARVAAAAKPIPKAAAPAASVTVKLPPARPAEQRPQLAAVAPPPIAHVVAQAAVPAPAAPAAAATPAKAATAAPIDVAELPIAPPRDLSMDVSIDAPSGQMAVPTKAPLLALAEPIAIEAAVPAAQPVQAEHSAVRDITDVQVPKPVRLPVDVAVDASAPTLTKAQAVELAALAPEIADIPAPPEPREQPKPTNDVLPAQPSSPRLVRLSPGEVALVTTAQPAWSAKKSPKGTKMAAVATVRWVPLSQPEGRPNVQVLNAARSQGIAASARSILTDRGWRRIAIGDAPTIRQTSVVFYPKERAKLGKSLARQFGIKARMVAGKTLVVLLGRDKVATIKAQRSA